jgi:hypothetical protein
MNDFCHSSNLGKYTHYPYSKIILKYIYVLTAPSYFHVRVASVPSWRSDVESGNPLTSFRHASMTIAEPHQ